MKADHAERAGLGASLAGHLLLFGALSVGYLAVRPNVPPPRETIEVDLVSETGLVSGAPQISNEAPAAKLAEVEAPIEPEPPAPTPIEAQPAPQPRPQPPEPVARQPARQPREAAKPAPKQQPKQQPKQAARNTRSGGRLNGLLEGISDRESASRSTRPPAAAITPAVQSSLAGAIRRQLRPHWKAPTGADAEQLRTELAITLAKDGSVTDIEVLRQTGVTASNRGQAPLHREAAIKAVRLAAPFQLPAEFYDAWKVLRPIGFDKRLSQ